MTTLRAAVGADIPAICAIWNAVIRDTDFTFTTREKTADDVAAMLRRHPAHGFLVAEDGSSLAGFACCDQLRPGPGYRHTLELSVHLESGARRRGIGAALVQGLIAHAAGQGVHTLWAGVSGVNSAALAFFAAQGFRPAAVLPEVGFKNARWFDLHLLCHRLDDPA